MYRNGLALLVERMPKGDSYLFEGKEIVSFSVYVDEDGYADSKNIEILSGKHTGDYVRIFSKITFWEDRYLTFIDINTLLEMYGIDSVGEFTALYNSNKVDHLAFYVNPKDDSLSMYKKLKRRFGEKDDVFVFMSSQNEADSEECFDEEGLEESCQDIQEVYDKVTKSIISQDAAVKKILSAIYMNQKLANSDLPNDKVRNLKQNILIAGSTGTGKSEIIKQIGKELSIPVVIEDATKFSKTGYVGSSVEDMIKHLVIACDDDIEKAQKAILVVDEIDKKAGGDKDDPSMSSVLNSLLKLVEGGVLHIEADKDSGLGAFDFDTSRLTIIFAGAFSEITSKKKETNTLGFTNTNVVIDKKKDLDPEDFVKYGMTPEFMGRISNIIMTKTYEREDYRKILLTSSISPLVLKREVFKILGVNLDYDSEFVEKILDEAVRLNTGARGLKLAFAKELEDLDFDILKGDVNSVKLSKDKAHVVRVKK